VTSDDPKLSMGAKGIFMAFINFLKLSFLDILIRFMIGRVRIVLIPHFGDIVIGKGMKGG